MQEQNQRKTSPLVEAARRWQMRETPEVHSYRRSIEMPVREAVTHCLSLRPRGTRRPTLRVYRSALDYQANGIDPFRSAKAFAEDMAFLRDGIAAGDLADFDGEMAGMMTAPMLAWLDAKAASNERRRRAAQREA